MSTSGVYHSYFESHAIEADHQRDRGHGEIVSHPGNTVKVAAPNRCSILSALTAFSSHKRLLFGDFGQLPPVMDLPLYTYH